MITGLVVTALLASLDALLSLLPGFTIPVSSTSTVGELGWTLNQFLPVAVLCTAALAVLGWYALMNLWNLVVWVYHQFWGSD